MNELTELDKLRGWRPVLPGPEGNRMKTIQVMLPDGISDENPELLRLIGEISSLRSPEPTTRERLAEKLQIAYVRGSLPGITPVSFTDLDAKEQASYLAEADAALEFVRELIASQPSLIQDWTEGEYDAGVLQREIQILDGLK